MKKILAVSLLSLLMLPAAVMLGGCHKTVVYGPAPPGVQIHDQGIHDGFEAARKDVADGHPPAFDQHAKYRNPPVPPEAWKDYRNGFREGYEQFLHHGPPPR